MNGKVLIVEDQADYRKILDGWLNSEYQIMEAENGAAAQRAMSQEQPDVVLLDVELGDANGLDLLPQLKKRWPETEVIVLTGAPTNDHDGAHSTSSAKKRGLTEPNCWPMWPMRPNAGSKRKRRAFCDARSKR